MTLNQSIVLREGQSCEYGCFVPLNTLDKPLQFTDLTRASALKLSIKLFSGPHAQHLGKLLNKVVGPFDLWIELFEGDECLLFISRKGFKLTKEEKSRRPGGE